MYQTSCECMIDKNWQDFWRFSLTLQPAVSQKMWCLVQEPSSITTTTCRNFACGRAYQGEHCRTYLKEHWSFVSSSQRCNGSAIVCKTNCSSHQPRCLFRSTPNSSMTQICASFTAFLITQWLKGSSFIITHAVAGYFVLHNHTIKLIWSCPLEGNSRDNTIIKFTKG